MRDPALPASVAGGAGAPRPGAKVVSRELPRETDVYLILFSPLHRRNRLQSDGTWNLWSWKSCVSQL